MTLTGRVSVFFLGWLALALAGFAVAVYLVARADLYRRTDDQLTATIDTLTAVTEIDDSGLIEWEPNDRTLPRPGESSDGITWAVGVSGQRVLDRTGSESTANWLMAETVRPPSGDLLSTVHDPAGSPWRMARRRLQAQPGFRLPSDPKDKSTKYFTLEVVAAAPLSPVHNELRRLAFWLTSLTAALWVTAALVGRWLCRRTLAPVAQMAAAARELSPTDPGDRLRVRPTGDELEDLGQAFNGALARLEEAFDRQARFTGDASHQLRTPLAAMFGQVEVALRRDRDAADYRTTLRSVADEIRHLHRLTEALLFLARADVEAGLPNLAEVNLAGWAATHIDAWRVAHPAAAIKLSVEGPLGPVRAHPELLAQLVDNLLDNALKYGPPGVPIQVRLRRQGPAVELIVEDAGPGIAAEDLPHVFDPFFRAAAARAAGVRGVGLGLSVARRIAEATGARLTAESEPGRGSRFAVRFPARESA